MKVLSARDSEIYLPRNAGLSTSDLANFMNYLVSMKTNNRKKQAGFSSDPAGLLASTILITPGQIIKPVKQTLWLE